jgi:hypothetical protein
LHGTDVRGLDPLSLVAPSVRPRISASSPIVYLHILAVLPKLAFNALRSSGFIEVGTLAVAMIEKSKKV